MSRNIHPLLGSNRPGHLFAAGLTGLALVLAGLWQQEPVLGRMGVTVLLWELVATPDMDHNSRGISGNLVRRIWVIFWRPYTLLIGHRSIWSHSLLFGTPARLLYLALPWIVLNRHQVDWYSIDPRDWLLNWGWFLASVGLADTVHMLKDNYAPGEILFGRRKKRGRMAR